MAFCTLRMFVTMSVSGTAGRALAAPSCVASVANSFAGVSKTYAIQAGREVRIIVESGEVSDVQAYQLSRDVAKRIEEELQYPGHIKVTVIRETRAVEYAK